MGNWFGRRKQKLTKKREFDKEKIQSHRRTKGKRMFNEEWRDLLLAFLSGLKKADVISISLSESFVLKMPNYPMFYWADFGYFDQKDKSRQGSLNTFEEEEIEND
jgi:hypothetical protein